MARKVTNEDIKQFNELYYKHKSYAEVARITGWSSSTVSKYVDKNYKPIVRENIRKFNLTADLPEFSTAAFEGVENWGELCVMSEEEKLEMAELWSELPL